MAAGESKESQRVLREFGQRLGQLRLEAGNPDGPQLIKADTSNTLTKTAVSELQKGRAGVYRLFDWDYVAAFVNACKANDEKTVKVLSAARTDLAEWKNSYTRVAAMVEEFDRISSKGRSASDTGGGAAAVPLPDLPQLAPLPVLPPGFTGRERDLEDLLGLIDPQCLPADSGPIRLSGGAGGTAVVVAAVHGMGGIGKTTLALAAGHAALTDGLFTGAVFLDLHGYDDTPTEPGQALDTVLRGLGVDPAQIPPDPDQRAAYYRAQLAARTRAGERVLVIADNASHTEQVEHLLPGDGPHRLLVTSRDDLSALGARLVDVDVLNPGQAVDLMDTAVRTALPRDGRISADRGGARRVAELCGHLPLALRIAAAQFIGDRSIKPRQLADDLEDLGERLDMLDDGTRGVRAVLERSYRRLPPPQAELFRLLAVNPGPDISTDTATALTPGKTKDVRLRLAGLARASLIRQNPDTARWRMHDLVRAYATEQAQQHPTASAKAQRRLLKHYTVTARDANIHLEPTAGGDKARFRDRAHALTWLDTEHANLIATVHTAQTTGHHDIAMNLPAQLATYLSLRRHLEDLLTVATTARDIALGMDFQDHTAQAWNNLGTALREVRRFEEAEQALRAALTTYQQLGNKHGEASAWNSLGLVLKELRRFEEAEQAHRTALTTHQQLGNKHGEASAWNSLGLVLKELRRFEEAEQTHRTALTTHQQLGDQYGEAVAWNNLGLVLGELRRFEEAEQTHRTALTTHQQLGNEHSAALAWNNIGVALGELRRFEEAEQAHRTALITHQQLGDQHGQAVAWTNLGTALKELRRFEEAEQTHRTALTTHQQLGDQHGQAVAWTNLGTALKELRRFEEAEQAQRTALTTFEQLGDQHGQALAWTNLGDALGELRRFEAAEEAHRTALTTFEQLGDQHGQAVAWTNLGTALKELRRFEAAEQAQRTALTTFEQLGDQHGQALAWNNLGAVLRGRGEFESAVEAGERSVAMFEVLRDEHRRGEALEELADILSAAGRPLDVVRAMRQDSAEAYRRAGAEEEAAKVLDLDGEQDDG
ncbi:tetratricopeptide repeat protein [Kitasatospora sp. NPDC101155]|uniref:tetratricopeptide repeat protein n=1 Tax=Kitasatospora sp. NPDC101155 TaxID=3364097 RepID=UPI0038207B4F